MKVSPLLAKICVVVSFAWDVRKLGYLEQAVSTVLSYPTSVDACVVTNAPDKLERVFASWFVSKVRPRVCAESWAADLDGNKYALLWRHRSILAAAAAGVLLLERLCASKVFGFGGERKAMHASTFLGMQVVRLIRHTCTWRTTRRFPGAR